MATVNGQAKNSAVSTTKPFTSLVQRAAAAAVREAAMWNAADAYIGDLLTSLSQAYNAARGGQGRLALALLRPKGPLSTTDEAMLRKETALVHLHLAIEEGEEAKARSVPPSTIQIFAGLPSEQRSCAEVQGLLGRAYHSLSQYHLAEKHFQHARRLSPSSITNMDIYSLTLFHLQREVELSQLSRELSQLDPANCITHIAAGNRYSLQKEHTFALHSFQRACHAAPSHAYAFTLVGYEANELGEREKSLQFFSEAIKIDKRHWNAYAGFGQIHLQEQKLQAAAYYYGRALDLHRTNAILWDVYGRVKMAQGHLTDAEKAFTLAIRLDERSAMSHVKLAELLLSRASVERQANVAQGHRDRAHDHLIRAVKIAPDEAHIHLMLAKSFMEKGHGHFATLLQHGRSNAADSMAVDGYRKEPQEVDMAELAVIGSVGAGSLLMQQQQQIRATGRANLPTHYRAEITRHLSTAIDLNPRLARYVKAMGEGARASLRGAAARLSGDLGDGSTMFDASLLPDELTAGVTDSMIEMDDDDIRTDDHDGVLEDAASDAATEVMLSETGLAEDEEEEGDFDGDVTEGEEGDADQDMDDSSQEMAEADLGGAVRSRHGLGLSFSDSDRHSEGLPRHGGEADEQDVSMSF
jgi:anaphase-promoting complex subunit 3